MRAVNSLAFKSLALAAFLFVGAASAQTMPKSEAPAKNWDGVWERVGGFSFDPTLPPGVLDKPPYNAEYQAKWQASLDAEKAGRPIGDPTANCLPPGMPRMMNMAFPMDVAVTSRVTIVTSEWGEYTHRIYTDGRPHPEDPDPSFAGHAIGYWKGGMLYTDTIALRADTRFNAAGAPHSDAMHLKERYWLADANTMKVEITVDDPKAFTKPWVVTKTFKRRPDFEIAEYVCQENNRNPLNANGETTLQLK